jgi:hypothetical protein
VAGQQGAVPRAPQRRHQLGLLLRGHLNAGTVWHSRVAWTRGYLVISSV